MKPLWLACLDYKMSVRQGVTPTFDNEPGWTSFRPEQTEGFAKQVVDAFRSDDFAVRA
jgi:hypothetical protein